jgi:hypothetical protein
MILRLAGSLQWTPACMFIFLAPGLKDLRNCPSFTRKCADDIIVMGNVLLNYLLWVLMQYVLDQ